MMQCDELLQAPITVGCLPVVVSVNYQLDKIWNYLEGRPLSLPICS